MNAYERRVRYIGTLRSQVYGLQKECRAAIWRARQSAREIGYLQGKFDDQYTQLIALLSSIEGSSTEGRANIFLLAHYGEGAPQALKTTSAERHRVRRIEPAKIDIWLKELERAVDKKDRRTLEIAAASIASELIGIAP